MLAKRWIVVCFSVSSVANVEGYHPSSATEKNLISLHVYREIFISPIFDQMKYLFIEHFNTILQTSLCLI